MSRTRALVVKARSTEATPAERHEAFGEIVRLFQDMAVACAYAALRDFHLAEDAAQEAFVAAWQRLPQLREPDAFPGWLRRIVLTQCARIRRGGERRRSAQLGDGDARAAADRAPGPAERAEARELKSSVVAAVASLPPAQRLVVLLFYFDGRTHEEIAACLELPRTTVAKRLHDARRRLKGLTAAKLRGHLDPHRPSRDESFARKVRRGIFDDYVGRYRYELRPDLEVVITREGERLYAEAAGQRNELFARPKDAEHFLRAREFDGRADFRRDARGRVTHFVYYEHGREMGRARKVG